jgi:hypothetical protein
MNNKIHRSIVKLDDGTYDFDLNWDIVDNFCDKMDPENRHDYCDLFKIFGYKINATYDDDLDVLVFDTEKDKLAFLLKYT